MQIRAAVVDDCPSVAQLYGHYVDKSVATFDVTAPDLDFWHAKMAGIRQGGWPFLVVTDAARVVGYAYVAPWHTKPAYAKTVEDTIYLDPASTGQGIGPRLLGELLSQAGSAGAREVVALIADTGLDASRTLHERAGFIQVGVLREVGFKHGRWIDVTVMQASLRP